MSLPISLVFLKPQVAQLWLRSSKPLMMFSGRIIEFFSADFPSTIPKEMLQKTDYTRPVYVQAHKAQMDPEIKKQGFTSRNGSSSPSGGVVKVYAPVAFASFRQALGISHRDYVEVWVFFPLIV